MPTHTDLETVNAGRYTDRIAFYDIAPAPMANTGVDIDVYTKDQVDAIVYRTRSSFTANSGSIWRKQ